MERRQKKILRDTIQNQSFNKSYRITHLSPTKTKVILFLIYTFTSKETISLRLRV